MSNPNTLSAMVSCDGDRIIVQGSVTIDNVVALTKQGAALFDEHHWVIDLDKVTGVDSTIISMLLEWLRAAHQKGYLLQFINMPVSLKSLIELYGVVELIPVPAQTTDQSVA